MGQKNNNALMNRSIEVEKAVIGALLIDNDVFDNISDIVSEKDFSLNWHQIAFKAIKNRLSNGENIDILILEDDLRKSYPNQEGMFAYLVDIVQNTPTSSNAETYANKLSDIAKVRELMKLGEKLQNISQNESIENVISSAEKQLFEITTNQTDASNISLSAALKTAVSKIENACFQNSAVSGIPTGLDDLDTMTTGFQPADFVVIAGRPGMGKTAFLLSSIKATLEQSEQPVLFFSLEMPSDQIITRLLSMVGNIPLQTLRNPLLLDDEGFAKLSTAINTIKQWENRLIIDDSPSLTADILRSRVRKYSRLHGQPAAIFVDYLQLMRYPTAPNRYEEISKISNALKALAKEMNCPVIALAQLNRAVEGRAIKRPTNADLRDSGQIEQDADVIILLHRDDYYSKDDEKTGLAEVIIGKQRNGPVGTVESYFAAQYSRFEPSHYANA